MTNSPYADRGAEGADSDEDVEAHLQARRRAALHETEEFTELRRRYRSFVIPATVGFLAWYLLYVVMSNWAHAFMSTKVVGNVNIALVFGILQFVTTFVLALVYARYSNAKLDPLARSLNEQYEEGRH